MSWSALDWCANLGPEVKAPLRSLLWAMANRANQDSGLVTAGVRRLGPEAGISPATAARLLVEAERRGLVELVREAAGSRPAWYRLACFASRQDETQSAAERPASVSSAARSVSPRVRRNPNPPNGETPQQRLARLAAQGDGRPGGRPPAPGPPRPQPWAAPDEQPGPAGWPPQLAASAW